MAQRTQLIRHATSQANVFTGLQGEITVDLTAKELRLHDEQTAGGIPIARKDLQNVADATNAADGKMTAAKIAELEASTTKLATIETGATADQTKADIDALGINAAEVGGVAIADLFQLSTDNTTTGDILIQKSSPRYDFWTTDGDVDEARWNFKVAADGTFELQTRTNAGVFGSNAMEFRQRVGTTVGAFRVRARTVTFGDDIDDNCGMEIGNTSLTASRTTFIDFHSAAGAQDYDVRVESTGGTSGVSGAGAFDVTAATLTFNGTVNANGQFQIAGTSVTADATELSNNENMTAGVTMSYGDWHTRELQFINVGGTGGTATQTFAHGLGSDNLDIIMTASATAQPDYATCLAINANGYRVKNTAPQTIGVAMSSPATPAAGSVSVKVSNDHGNIQTINVRISVRKRA